MRRGVAWLHAELPTLVERGVLTAEAADSLRRHYGPPDAAGGANRWGQILLASFGALLVGGGVILILAHNWDALGRPARAAIALGILLAAQGLTLYAGARRAASVPWREASAGLLVAAVGAAMALVGQTYNLGGTFEDLLRGWLWLILPVQYLTGSTLAALGFWALLAVRAPSTAWTTAPPLDFWPLIFAGAPFVAIRAMRYPESWATTLLTLGAAVSTFFVGSVLTLNHGWDGMWAVFQMSFVAAIVAVASWPVGVEGIGWRRRLLYPAWILLIVLGAILSFDDPWRSLDNTPSDFRNVNTMITAIVALGCAGFASFATIQLASAGRLATAAGTASGGLIITLHALALGGVPDAGWIVFNLWLLAVGALSLAEGIRLTRLATANRGLLAVAACVVARFFDTDLSFLLRGLAFVALGMSCFAVNFWLMRRGRRQTA